MANQTDWTPTKLHELMLKFSTLDPIKKDYIARCQTQFNFDPIAAVVTDETTWDEFFRQFPLPLYLIDKLREVDALTPQQYSDLVKASGLDNAVQPYRRFDKPFTDDTGRKIQLLPARIGEEAGISSRAARRERPGETEIPTATVPREETLVPPLLSEETPETAGEKYTRALEEEEARLRRLQERLRRVHERPPIGRSEQILEVAAQIKHEISRNKRQSIEENLKRIERGKKLGIPLIREEEVRLDLAPPLLRKKKIVGVEVTSGTIPSNSIRVLTRDALEEVIHASPFHDGSRLRPDFLEVARDSPQPSITKQATDQVLAEKATQLIACDRIKREIIKAIQLQQVDRYTTLPDSALVEGVAEIVSDYVVPDQLASWNKLRQSGMPLDKVETEAQDYLRTRIGSSAFQNKLRQEIRDHLQRNTTISDPRELNEKASEYLQAGNAVLQDPKGIIPHITISTSTDPHGRGIVVNLKEYVIHKGKVSAGTGRLILTDDLIEMGDVPDSAAVRAAYQVARSREEKSEELAKARRTRDFTQWIRRANPTDRELESLAQRDDIFKKWYKEKKIEVRRIQTEALQVRAQAFAQGVTDELNIFEDNPLGYVLTAPPRFLFYNFAPRRVRDAYEKARDFVTNKETSRKLLPWLDSGTYARGNMLHWLSHITGWVDIDPRGQLTLGPVKWLNWSYRNALQNWGESKRGKSFLNFERNFINSLTMNPDKSWTGVTRNQAQRALNLDPTKKHRALRAKTAKRYIDGEIGLLAFIVASIVGSAISAGVTWALEKLGLMKYVREVQHMFIHISNGWNYGAGASSRAYHILAKNEWLHGSKFRGGVMRALSFTGRKIFPTLKIPIEGIKILGPNLLRAAGVWAVSYILTGMNPAASLALAGSYFGIKTADAFLRNPYFFGKYFMRTPSIGSTFARPGFSGMRSVYLAVENEKWVGLAERVLYGKWVNGRFVITRRFPKFWARLSRAYDTWGTPFLGDLKHLKIPAGYKWGAWIWRNIPIDGLVWFFWLGQFNAPMWLRLGAIGIDFASKFARGIFPILSKSWWGRLLLRPWVPISTLFDTLIGAYTLYQIGGEGWMDIWKRIFPLGQGFTLETLLQQLGVLSPGIGMFSLVALIAGGVTWPVVAAALLFEAAVLITDTIFREAMGISLWEWIWPRIEKFLENIFGSIGQGMVNLASAFMGIVGLVQSLMRGEPVGIAISIAMLTFGLGGILGAGGSSMSTGLSATYTPTGGGEIEVTPSNAYIEDFSKAYRGSQPPQPEDQLLFEYSFYVKQDAEITEIDKFYIKPSKRLEIEKVDFINLDPDPSVSNNTITFDPAHYGSGNISRSYTIYLTESLSNFLTEEDDLFCNEVILQISGEKDLSIEKCINRKGNTAGFLDNLPIIPGEGGSYVSSCYGPRGGGFHHGFDIAAAEGIEIYAAGSGTVELAGRATGMWTGLGNMVLINHGQNKWTAYGHMQNVHVSKDQTVQGGAVIGTVGHTGYVIGDPGNHLHFATYDNVSSYISTYNPCLEESLNLCTSYADPYNLNCSTEPPRP